MSERFDGFPQGTVKFLKQLKSNNNRDWFNENKHRYETDLLEPSLCFIESMQPGIKKVSPYFHAIAKRTGGSLMRIYRDTRFSKDKTPYKTNIGIHFRHEMGRDVHAPGFYFHIDPEEVFFGAGIWHPDNKTLRKIRDEIVEEENVWRRVSANKKIRQHFEFAGDSLKRPPRDFDPDHPLIEDLKRKDFIVVKNLAKSAIFEGKLADSIVQLMKCASPLMRFLCQSLKIPY